MSHHRQTLVSWSETKPVQLHVSIFPHCHSATYWFAMKQEVLWKSTLHYPTGSELLTHDHNPDLNSSISEYEFRVIAPPTDQCEHYIVVTLSNWNKIAHATSERLLEQIYESVCNNSDGATYWQQQVTFVLQISFDFHSMFTAWCAIDRVDRNEQLADRDPRLVTDAGSEAFVLAAVRQTRVTRRLALGHRPLSPRPQQATTC